jgi:hypothetical protein
MPDEDLINRSLLTQTTRAITFRSLPPAALRL